MEKQNVENVKRGRGRPRIPAEEKRNNKTKYMLNKEWICDVCYTERDYTLAGKWSHMKTKMHQLNQEIKDMELKGIDSRDVYSIMKKTGASKNAVLLALYHNYSDISDAIEYLENYNDEYDEYDYHYY